MTTDSIVHVQVEDTEEKELEEVNELLNKHFPKRDIVVSDERTELGEIPVLDEFVDEVVQRVKKEIDKNENRL